MSDTLTPKAPETAPEGDTAPEKAPVASPGPVDLETFLRLEGEAVDAQVDVPAFTEGVALIIAQLPKVKKAEDAYNAARMALATAIIACRNAVTFHGAPDTFGASKVYKALFRDWIVSQVAKAHPTMDRKWIKTELDYVRINYLGSSATRSKGLLFESVIRDAATSGKIPGAVVQDDGTIVVPVLTRKKDAEGNPIPKVEKGPDGTETPVVSVYKPGQQVDVPTFAKKVVQDVIATAAPKKKDANGAMVATVNVPVRFGGAEPEPGGGGGDKPKGPEDYAKAFRDAYKVLTETDDNLATPEMLAWFHAAASRLCDTLNRKDLTNAKDHAKVLETVSKLLHAEAALLDGNSTATLEKVQALQHTPEDAKAPEAPETAPETPETPKDDNNS